MKLYTFYFFMLLHLMTCCFAENVTFTPRQSISASVAGVPQIASDASGKYVYAISEVVEILRSSDFGVTWTNTGVSFGAAENPQITTNSSGQYVYGIWRDAGTSKIKIFFSSDFGITWTNADPSVTIFGDGDTPQIITDSTGEHVYAIWTEGFPGAIKIFISSDFGVSWSAATGAFTASADFPQIVTDDSGKFGYATWHSDVSDELIIFTSSDFGNNWALVVNTLTASKPQITTDSSGQFAYVIWQILGGVVKILGTNDFGNTWTFRDNAWQGDPLGGALQNIAANSSGRYVYAHWIDNNANIKIFVSSDFGSTWRDAGAFGKATVPANNMQITTDNIGRHVYAIWENSSGNITIYFSTDFGSTWTSGGTFETGVNPRIITSDTGQRIYGIWSSTIVYITRGISSFFPLTLIKAKTI